MKSSIRAATLVLSCLAIAALGLGTPAKAVGPEEVDAPAPELTGGPWLNTPHGSPIRVAGRRGRVTVLHFWTFG